MSSDAPSPLPAPAAPPAPAGLALRPAAPADYGAVARILRAHDPAEAWSGADLLRSDAAFRPPHRLHRLVAEGAGSIVGYALAMQSPGAYHPRRFFVELVVDPGARGRGLGLSLYSALLDEIADARPERLRLRAPESRERALALLQRLGYRETQRDWTSTFEPARLEPAAVAAAEARLAEAGATVASYAALIEERGEDEAARVAHAIFSEARRDVPRSEPATDLSLEDYRRFVLEEPGFLPEALWIAFGPDGGPIGMTQLYAAEGGGLDTGLTGVVRAWRGRGIATALKVAALAWARERGAPSVRTDNASTNAAMLAVNDRLGFVRGEAWLSLALDLGEDGFAAHRAEVRSAADARREEVGAAARDLRFPPADRSDAALEAVAAAWNADEPEHPVTAAEVREDDEARDRDERIAWGRRLALRGGRSVGFAYRGHERDRWAADAMWAGVRVDPADPEADAIAERLYRAVETDARPLGVRVLRTSAREDRPGRVALLRALGYRETARAFESVLDLAAFDPDGHRDAVERVRAAGVEVLPWAEVEDDEATRRAAWRLHNDVDADVPIVGTFTPAPFEAFEAAHFDAARFDPALFWLARDADGLVGMTELWRQAASPDLHTGLTGVRRRARRRGVALALKVASLAAAKRTGAPRVRTWNDAANEGMLAINVALGFERQPAQIEWERRLEPLAEDPTEDPA